MLCAGGFVRRSSNMSILKAVRGPALASWGLRAFAYGASDLSSCLRVSSCQRSSYSSSAGRALPGSARVVVCGAGVVGCSLAYHMPKVGFKDVLLLEQGKVGSGSTWHAAGLGVRIRGTIAETKICKYGTELYSQLEAETGFGTGWKMCGGLDLARNEGRLTALRRLQSIGRICGVETEIISPEEAKTLCPLIRSDDLVGALWTPGSGVMTSSDVCTSLLKGATKQGVQLCEGVSVEGVEVENGRVCGVRTNKGDIKCEIFVNCAGMWGRELGQLSDPPVSLPLHPSEHFYIVSKPLRGVDPMMPAIRDHCGCIYIREWSGGILAGGFEPRGKPCFQDGIPKPFEFELLPEDWDHFQFLMEQILHRLPVMEDAEIRQMVNGPESFTPDTHSLLGEAPNIGNYYVAVGMNSAGIASAAGAGRALAEWIAGGEPPLDLWHLDVSRFGPEHNNLRFLDARTSESLGRLYAMPWPRWEMETARMLKTSPLHSRLEEAGASWGCVMGWERPNWFARDENEHRVNSHTYGRPNWFENVREEHLACRENVAVFDLSSLAKFEIEGPGVEAAMQELCANDVAVPVGQIVYTGMLNHQGGYVTDCTVTRLAQNKYLAVCPAGQASHDAAWISRHLPSPVSLRDTTARYVVLAVMGPRSRELLQPLTKTPLDNTSFPFGTMQVTDVGAASGVRAMRITYVGELGWELHVPTEFAVGVYNELMDAGRGLGVRNAGMYALDSLRMEKGYRHWGHELDSETTPLEARLSFAVNMNKDNFIGRDALLKQRMEGVQKLLGIFAVDTRGDEDILAWGHESIYCSGKLAGYVTSASYGYLIGKPICMGFISYSAPGTQGNIVSPDILREGRYEVEINGKLYPADITLRPLHDPGSLRVKM